MQPTVEILVGWSRRHGRGFEGRLLPLQCAAKVKIQHRGNRALTRPSRLGLTRRCPNSSGSSFGIRRNRMMSYRLTALPPYRLRATPPPAPRGAGIRPARPAPPDRTPVTG